MTILFGHFGLHVYENGYDFYFTNTRCCLFYKKLWCKIQQGRFLRNFIATKLTFFLCTLTQNHNYYTLKDKSTYGSSLFMQELHEKLSTSDLVTNEIQEAFGRQLAALHRQRDALIEQLEQHRKDHQGYARVVQEKATLEDRLREEKKLLSEKLSQKEALEMELAAEREALNEKLIELEKLREMLNGKEKLTDELTKQRDELKVRQLIQLEI